LSEVAFIDSSGVGLLANFAKRLRKHDGRVALFNYREDIKELLDITGLDQAMGIYEDMDRMIATMTGGADGQS